MSITIHHSALAFKVSLPRTELSSGNMKGTHWPGDADAKYGAVKYM